MILVKDLNKDIFPASFLNYLPETCDSCGSPNEIIETLSTLQCSNPNCISKVGYRLFKLLKDIGICILDVEECIKFLREFNTTNPYSIFLYNPVDGELYEGCGLEKSKQIYKMLNKRRGMLLSEYIKIGQLENLSDSAEKLLKNYDSLASFYKDLSDGIPFIQKLLLEDTDYSEDNESICVNAVLIYETFMKYREDLEAGLKGVVILKPDKIMSVVFANNVSDFESNQEFLYTINKQLKNQIYLYQTNMLSDKVNFVYWENIGLNTLNSLMKEIKENYPNIRQVDSGNIFEVMLEVLENG